jgi:hypothetical protein
MKRINPNTGKPFKRGDTREGGMVFAAYQLKRKLPSDSQYYYENWRTPEDFARVTLLSSEQTKTYRLYNRVNVAKIAAKRRAKRTNTHFELTTEYLNGIYPADGLCPVFKTPLVWGGEGDDRNNSPSLDRIVPELGYVEGNVVWISNRANILKRDATWEELQRVAKWLKSVTPG